MMIIDKRIKETIYMIKWKYAKSLVRYISVLQVVNTRKFSYDIQHTESDTVLRY